MKLIIEVQDARLKYYRKFQLVKLKSYFGTGMEPGKPDWPKVQGEGTGQSGGHHVR